MMGRNWAARDRHDVCKADQAADFQRPSNTIGSGLL
jgi:hypothetical protein